MLRGALSAALRRCVALEASCLRGLSDRGLALSNRAGQSARAKTGHRTLATPPFPSLPRSNEGERPARSSTAASSDFRRHPLSSARGSIRSQSPSTRDGAVLRCKAAPDSMDASPDGPLLAFFTAMDNQGGGHGQE